MTTKYFRKPSVMIQQPSDVTAAFTMRLLNFLFTLKMQGQKGINPIQVEYYARRHTRAD